MTPSHAAEMLAAMRECLEEDGWAAFTRWLALRDLPPAILPLDSFVNPHQHAPRLRVWHEGAD